MGSARTPYPALQPAEPILADHLVSIGEDRGRHCQPERLGRVEIDGQIEFARRLDRQIGGIAARCRGLKSRIMGTISAYGISVLARLKLTAAGKHQLLRAISARRLSKANHYGDR